MREIIWDAVKDCVSEHHTDALGNLIVLKRCNGRSHGGPPPKVMVTAHMDEVGFMITAIDDSGMLKFSAVGGIDPRVLPAKGVVIGERRLSGVIGMKAVHLSDAEERGRVMPIDKLYLDIGASTKQQAQQLVRVGDYATFDTKFERLAVGALRSAVGKALDDRVGCAVLAELLRDDYSCDLYGVFTVQEEVGLRGARVAAYRVAPDVAIGLEGTICDDLPKDRDVSPVTRVGDGPSITIMDRSLIVDKRLVKLLVESANEANVPYQFKQAVSGGTDAGAVHLAREGTPAAVVSVPVRYIHSSACLMSLVDYEHTVRLMKQALHKLEGGLPA